MKTVRDKIYAIVVKEMMHGLEDKDIPEFWEKIKSSATNITDDIMKEFPKLNA